MEKRSRERAAVARSKWLAQLAKAIDDAQRLAWRLGVVEGRGTQAMDLYARLEAVREEVEVLRGRNMGMRASGKSDGPAPFDQTP